jgi:glycosyltransferase involved in cell wall biosynthesis
VTDCLKHKHHRNWAAGFLVQLCDRCRYGFDSDNFCHSSSGNGAKYIVSGLTDRAVPFPARTSLLLASRWLCNCDAAVADPKFRRLRVLHLVSADGKSAPNPLLVPLLARGNRQHIETQVLSLTLGDARYAVVRQSGLPVHEMALSRKRFSLGAYFDAKKLVAQFKPDVLHAWGSSAQLLANALVWRSKKRIPIVWSVSRTAPLHKNDDWLTRTKFAQNVKLAAGCQRIVYPSAVAAANYRRAGLPEAGVVIAPGVDAERFKPDDAARERVRKQLELPPGAILIGMVAPYAPEFDHGTFLKAMGELIRINSSLYCVLAGRGMVKGNAPLSAMLGGSTLGTRTRIVGEWTDLGALFNACDVVCSSAATDSARLTLALSMLCGVMCVATGVGAQGEVLGSFGVSVEPGSPDGMARGIRRILEMPAERRAFMAQAARKHVLQNFNMTRSIEKYHELYQELVTGTVSVATSNAEADAKEAAQSLAAAEIITNRAAATSLRAAQVVAQPAAEKDAQQSMAEEPATGFGAVQQVTESVKAPASTANQINTDELAKNDTINFDALATSKVPTYQSKSIAAVEESSDAAAPWSEADGHLLDEILVEADAETAKANADKAAGAAKNAAAKAAANAALAAALAGNPDAAKTLDPKMLAALNLSGGGTSAYPSSPRAVAGKAPPAPSNAAPKPATPPALTVVKTGTSDK